MQGEQFRVIFLYLCSPKRGGRGGLTLSSAIVTIKLRGGAVR
jgi:hypothetical protein